VNIHVGKHNFIQSRVRQCKLGGSAVGELDVLRMSSEDEQAEESP
jgi:hypothetical protein